MTNNVNFSAIHLGSMADMDTNESNYSVENASNLLGVYGSASNPLYKDIVTLDTDSSRNAMDVDHYYGGHGTFTYDVGAGSVTSGFDCIVLYKTTVTFVDGTTTTLELDVIQTMDGDVFAIPWDGFAILGTQGIESLTLHSVYGDNYAGIYQTDFDAVQFVCFANGTRIRVPQGETRVEDLQVGDLVETLDHGPQPLRWTGARRLRFPASPETQKPVEFKPGTLAAGEPRRRLVVSPQHRILISGGQKLAAAHCLEGLKGARRMSGRREITYVTLLFERHEIIFAEGAAVESLYPGPMALAVLSPFQRLEILTCLPGLMRTGAKGYGPFARPVLMPKEARRWVARQAGTERNQDALGGGRPSSARFLRGRAAAIMS